MYKKNQINNVKGGILPFFTLILSLHFFFRSPNSVFSQAAQQNQTEQKKFIDKFNLGKHYFTINETRLALPIFEDLYLTQPFNSNINYLLGICYTEEDPLSGKSILHLSKAMKDVSMDYDASSFSEKRTPIFVYYYLTIAYSQNGKCKEAKQAFNYFHTLYGIEKHDYYITDAENWIKKCKKNPSGPDSFSVYGSASDSGNTLVTKNIDYTTRSALYGVQVGAFSRLVPVYEFAGLKNVHAFIDKQGMIRYVIGNFIFKRQAENLLKAVHEAGYKESFIVDVNKEKKFSEELVIANNISMYKNAIEKVNFKVQIGAFNDSIPASIAKIFLRLEGIEETTENDQTILSIGNFLTYEEAEKFKNEVIISGISDAFIVAWSENKKIDVKLAKNFYGKKE